MAEIYRAKTAGVGGFEKLVALKVIHPNYSEDPEFVQMLVDEAKLAVHLQHANIVQTFDLGKIEDQYYIAMELIDGVDLYKLLRTSSEKDLEFPFEVAAFIAEEAAQGLDYAHRKRDERGRPLEIVHRDISPQNILVTYDGEVKIVDFGIAKAARRRKQTAAGVIKGKYYYMSPEQAWGDAIDARTDIFSTGILLYEMLVGQMLYLEEDMDLLLEKVRKAVIAKPSVHRKSVPAQLENIAMKALAKRPEDRYQTAGELATALARFVRTRAPDFNRAKLAAWVKQVLGGSADTTERNQQRDPKVSTAVRRAEIERDDNSLIFKLEELKKKEKAAANAPQARRGDQPTSPVKMPDLARAAFTDALGDYGENDATIVDGTGETLMAALAAAGDEPEESTRELGPAELRKLDEGDTDFDEEESVDSGQILTGDSFADDTDRTAIEKRSAPALKPGKPKARPSEPKLPGVPSLPPVNPKGRYEGGDTPQDDDDTDERPKPTTEMRAPKVDEEATAVPSLASSAPTAPWPAPSNQPLSSNGGPQMVPLPSGLPLLNPQQQQQHSTPINLSSSGRFTTDAIVKSLQPGRSRLVLTLVGAALAGAAVVAVLTGNPGVPARGTIEVVSSPAGATVQMDGITIQQPTPLVITDVDPARIHHVFVAFSKGGEPPYDPWESDVKFEGDTRQVRLQAILVPVVGTLDLSSTPPGAEAIVNGRIAGVTPLSVGDLPPGDEVVVELRLRGYRAARRSFSFSEGGVVKRRLEISIPLEKAH
jgi:serine/threonine-protein kinase